MVIGELKYLIEPRCGTYHPTILTLFPCGYMVSAEHGSVLEGGGLFRKTGIKGKSRTCDSVSNQVTCV
jgi:hypothetical protein